MPSLAAARPQPEEQMYLRTNGYCNVGFGRKALCSGATFSSRSLFSSQWATSILCGMTVWLVLVPLFFLVAVAGTLAYGVLWSVPWWLWMACRGQTPQNWTISQANTDLLEDKCTATMFPPGTRSEWITLLPRRGASGVFASAGWRAHRVLIPCRGGRKRDAPELIVIHGSGSAATLMMSSCAKELSEKFVLHCIDLPGYGRTEMPEGVSLQDAERLSGSDIIGMHCEFIERYCVTCNINKPFVIAHSAGAFFAMMWASTHRDPSALGGVVLVSLAGCLPTFNICAAYVSVAFLFGVPQRFFRLLGRAGRFIFQPAVHANLLAQYWLHVQSSPSYLHVASNFSRTSLFSAIWLYPGLLHLLRAAAQTGLIATVVGASDALASDTEMAVVSQLAAQLQVFLPSFSVPGAGHRLFHHDSGSSVVGAILSAHALLTSVPRPLTTCHRRLKLFERRLERSTWRHTYSSFDIFATRVRRHQLYAFLSSLAPPLPAQVAEGCPRHASQSQHASPCASASPPRSTPLSLLCAEARGAGCETRLGSSSTSSSTSKRQQPSQARPNCQHDKAHLHCQHEHAKHQDHCDHEHARPQKLHARQASHSEDSWRRSSSRSRVPRVSSRGRGEANDHTCNSHDVGNGKRLLHCDDERGDVLHGDDERGDVGNGKRLMHTDDVGNGKRRCSQLRPPSPASVGSEWSSRLR